MLIFVVLKIVFLLVAIIDSHAMLEQARLSATSAVAGDRAPWPPATAEPPAGNPAPAADDLAVLVCQHTSAAAGG